MKLIMREQRGRCEDCDLRNALDPMGKPRTSRVYGYKMTHGCEGCGGTGKGGERVDLDAAQALSKLTAKQRFVIERRYGFVDGQRYTQEEIARVMGITRQSVTQHERLALKKLAAFAGIPAK